jgi:hypothetical protein
MMGGDTRPTVWIRYNPDVFSVNGKKLGVKSVLRHRMLLQTILDVPITHPLQIVYLHGWFLAESKRTVLPNVA